MTNANAIPDGSDSNVRLDGRRAWRDRNRLAVVDALLDLYAEGNMMPSAQEVADRSGVSRRSVFRYFDDLDGLARTAIERQNSRVVHLVEIPNIGEGPIADRAEILAKRRVVLFENARPAARVSRLRAPFNRVIAEGLQQNRRFLSRQIEQQFAPELDAMGPATRQQTLALADTLCSFETFDLLTNRGMQTGEAAAAITHGLRALFHESR